MLFAFVSCETRTGEKRKPEELSEANTPLPQTAEHRASGGIEPTRLCEHDHAAVGRDHLRLPAECDPNPIATWDHHSATVKRDDFTMVAVVFDEDTEDVVTDELKQHHIDCFSEASLGLAGACVHKCDAIRAREIVRRSVRINHEQVRLAEEWKREVEKTLRQQNSWVKFGSGRLPSV
jgi:uncharacterized protein with PIN domain